MKLNVNSCSWGNPSLYSMGSVLRDHQGCFWLFSWAPAYFFAELMVVCKGLDLTTKPVYFVLEVESDLETVVSWITFQAFVR